MITQRNRYSLAVALVGGSMVFAAMAEETNKWTIDASVFGLAAGMSGDVTIRGVDADLDLGIDDILSNLEMGGMGAVRVGYGRVAFRAEVIFMGLGASKNTVSADLDQWIVEPTVSYRLCDNAEVLAGARYNSLSADIHGTGPLGNFRESSGTMDWWDPIIGVNGRIPISKNLSFDVRGDIGGFDFGSELTWQAFPYLSWKFASWGSMQVGYRWVYVDYEEGGGNTAFRYDVLSQGPQLGVTFHF